MDAEKDHVGSYEHDGLFVWRLPTLANDGWQQELLARIPRQIKVGMKEIPSADQLLQQLREVNPSGDWESIDENWEAQMDHIMAARPGAQLGKEDRLYAQVVALEKGLVMKTTSFPCARSLSMRAVAIIGISTVGHGGGRATRRQGKTNCYTSSRVLVRRLPDYRWDFDDNGGEVLRSAPSARGTILSKSHLVIGVEKMLRAPLTDKSFELDGENTRKFTQFNNSVFERKS